MKLNSQVLEKNQFVISFISQLLKTQYFVEFTHHAIDSIGTY